MSIKSSDEDFTSRTGAYTAYEGAAQRYTRVFRVLMTSTYDGPNLACSAPGINIGDAYEPNGNEFEFDTHAYCNGITATQVGGDGIGWDVVVEYGPYSSLWAGGGPKQNPLLQPIDVSWSQRSQEIVADQDINGNPIVNTAGDAFDPPLMEDDPRFVLTVIRNEPTFNQAMQIQYRNAINSDPFAGYDPLMVRVLEFTPENLFHQDVGWYYKVTYSFECKPAGSSSLGDNGYRRRVLNQGMRALSVVSGKRFVPNFKGVPITEPVLLNDAGNTLDVGAAPVFLEFQTKPELSFAAFQFDPVALLGNRTGFVSGYGNPFYGALR